MPADMWLERLAAEASTLPRLDDDLASALDVSPARDRRRRREEDEADLLDAFESGGWTGRSLLDMVDSDDAGEESFTAALASGDRARRRRRIDRDRPRETAPEFDAVLPPPPTFASPWTSLLDTDEVAAGMQPTSERTTLMDRLAPRAGRFYAQSPPPLPSLPRAQALADGWERLPLPRRPVKQPQRMLHLFCATEGCGSPLVCSRGLLTRTYHGLPHGYQPSIERQNRLTPAYTSDCPPSDAVALIDELERLGTDSERTVRDGCSCVRAGMGCRQCGTRLGHLIVRPCSLCLRECATGHCFIFDANAVVACPRWPGDDSTVVYEPEAVEAIERRPLMWSGPDTPSPRDDLAAGLVGDPVDWVFADGSGDGDAAWSTRCPYWLVKSRTQAAAKALEEADTSTRQRRANAPPPQPTSSALSGTSLTRSHAMRVAHAPIEPVRRSGFNLSSPNGEDIHSVLESLAYGSLSTVARTAKPDRSTAPYARSRPQLVGR